LLVLLALVVLAVAKPDPHYEFSSFVAKYGKFYHTQEEYEYRFRAFRENLIKIEALNKAQVAAGGHPCFGVNAFADMPAYEFAQRLMKNLTYPPQAPAVNFTARAAGDVDWRSKNVITPVKDQGQCGSCWAHSATEALESFAALAGKSLIELSVQQPTACTYSYDGCNGGWPYDAYVDGIESRNGDDTAADYPYNIPQAGNCRFGATGKADAPVIQLSGYKNVARGGLQTALLNNGPVSVCVAAESWQTYTGGILKTCTGQVDHCVQAVGYTTSTSESYWVVRNSWGASWGEQGYIYLDMTANSGDICHIQEYITYPTF